VVDLLRAYHRMIKVVGTQQELDRESGRSYIALTLMGRPDGERSRKMRKHYKVTGEFRQFCKSLFDRRFEAGVSQTDVAKAIGVDQATVSRIERGAFGDVIRDNAYGAVCAYAKAYSLAAPVLEEGAKAVRNTNTRVVRAPRKVASTVERPSSVKHDATATILRLVASGAIPPDVAGIVIKALAS